MTDEQRKHIRFPVEIAGEVSYRGEIVAASTENLSAGGVALLVDRNITDGSRIQVTLFLTQDGIEDPDEDPFESEATVRWTTPRGDEVRTLGIEFAPLSALQEKLLERFLKALDEE